MATSPDRISATGEQRSGAASRPAAVAGPSQSTSFEGNLDVDFACLGGKTFYLDVPGDPLIGDVDGEIDPGTTCTQMPWSV